MLLGGADGAEALGVHEEHAELGAVLGLDGEGGWVDPEAARASVDGRADLEQHLAVALPSAAGDRGGNRLII